MTQITTGKIESHGANPVIVDTTCLSIESKSIITDIANSFSKIFNIDNFRDVVRNFVSEKYTEGVNEIESTLDFNVQFGDQVRDTALLEKYTFDNIKGMTDDIQNKLRQELQRGLLGNESQPELIKRIGKVFSGKEVGRINYDARMKMIARTEGKRASNMAKFANAERLDRPLWKYTKLHPRHKRTGCDCDKIANMEPVALEKMYTTKQGDEKYPPFHPNCMCSIIITTRKEK